MLDAEKEAVWNMPKMVQAEPTSGRQTGDLLSTGVPERATTSDPGRVAIKKPKLLSESLPEGAVE